MDRPQGGMKQRLLEDWENRSKMFLHSTLPVIKESDFQQSRCQQLGVCVCKGVGRASWLLAKALTQFLKPPFTPPRKKRNSEEARAAEQSPEDKRKKLNRKLLTSGMIVLKLSPRAAKAKADDRALEDLGGFGPDWAAFALASLAADEPLSSQERNASLQEVWLHIGHVNLSSWAVTIMRLMPVGAESDQGFQRLEVRSMFVKPAAIAFAELFTEDAFAWSWNVSFYVIHTQNKRQLHGNEMRPNWVMVRQFNVNGTDGGHTFGFWRGLKIELQAETDRQKRLKQQAKRTVRKGAARLAGMRARVLKDVHPKARARLKVQKRVQKRRRTVPSVEVIDFDLNVEEDLGEAEAETEEIEDAYLSRAGKEVETVPDNPAQENEESIASDLEKSDLEDSLAESLAHNLDVGAGGGEASNTADIILPPAATRDGSSSSSKDKQDTEVEVVKDSKATATTDTSVGGTATTRRAPHGPDLAVSVTDETEIRFNVLTQRLIAVCKRPGHGDCRRSRTVQESTRDSSRYKGQGRPVGLLVHFLLVADQYEDGKAHRAILEKEIPFEDRMNARTYFESLPNSRAVLGEERGKRVAEGEEPEHIV